MRRAMLARARALITVAPSAFTTLGSSTYTAPQTGTYYIRCAAHSGGGGAGRLAQRGGGGGTGGVSETLALALNAGDQLTLTNVAGGTGGVSVTSAGTAPDPTGTCQVALTVGGTVVCSANPGKGGVGGNSGVPGAVGAGGVTAGAVGDTLTAGNPGVLGAGGNSPAGLGTGGAQGNPGGTGGTNAGGGAGTTSGNGGGAGGPSVIHIGYTY